MEPLFTICIVVILLFLLLTVIDLPLRVSICNRIRDSRNSSSNSSNSINNSNSSNSINNSNSNNNNIVAQTDLQPTISALQTEQIEQIEQPALSTDQQQHDKAIRDEVLALFESPTQTNGDFRIAVEGLRSGYKAKASMANRASYNSNSMKPYLEEELTDNENRVWWEDFEELEQLM